MWVSKIISNNISTKIEKTENYIGSNMFAFNSKKTTDGDTYFAINTHQPLDGPVSGMKLIFVVKKEQIF